MGTDVYAQSMATAMRGTAKVHSSRRLIECVLLGASIGFSD